MKAVFPLHFPFPQLLQLAKYINARTRLHQQVEKMKFAAATVCVISALYLGVCEANSASGYESVQEWAYPEELLQRALENRGQRSATRLYAVPRETGPLAFLKRGGEFPYHCVDVKSS